MKKGITLILRFVLFLAGAAMLMLSIGAALSVLTRTSDYIPPLHLVILLLVLLFGTAIPFCIAIFNAFVMLYYIDKNRVFTQPSVKVMRRIKRCTVAVFIVLAAIGIPFFSLWAHISISPGLVLIGVALAGGAFIVAIFTALLCRLLHDAIALQSDSDLTI